MIFIVLLSLIAFLYLIIAFHEYKLKRRQAYLLSIINKRFK
jgi:uncharacterized membrane protein YesL